MKNKFFLKKFTIAILITDLAVGAFLPQPVQSAGNTTHTWDINTTTSADYTYDPTLITIDDTDGAYPNNRITNGDFENGTTGWSAAAAPPTGWVEVPGDVALYNTSNFLVMKYEAKCANSATPTVGLKTPTVGYGDYNDSGTGGSACTSANSKVVTSIPSGYAIASLNQAEVLARCQSVVIGSTNSHLLSNDEWMTISRNIEAQDANWSLGSVGQGYLYAGHNDGSPLTALEASSTDTGNYSCAYTDGSNPAVENPSGSCPTFTAIAKSGTAGLQRRIHTLSNNSTIWDMAGNVYEWTSTNLVCVGTSCTSSEMPYGATPASEWLEFATGATGWAGDILTTYGAYSWDKLGPLNHTFNSDQGIGRLLSDANAASQPTGATHSFHRGGYWAQGLHSGVFNLYLSIGPEYRGGDVGFRCASDPVAISQSNNSGTGLTSSYGNRVSVGNVSNGKMFQSINLGNTDTYDIWTYLYDRTSGNVGGTVNSGVAELYANGIALTTTYTDMTSTLGAGWWKLSGSVVGANESREYGLEVKTGKTVDVDNFFLIEQSEKPLYTPTLTADKLVSWDSFDITENDPDNLLSFQFCPDDGSTCENDNSWLYYDGSSWVVASNNTTDVNTFPELTTTTMQELVITHSKLSVKVFFPEQGNDVPTVSAISVGYTTDTTGPVGSLIISTNPINSNKVTLNFQVSDDYSDAIEMMICENPEFTGCSFEPFSSTKTWELSGANGEKHLYVIFRDGFGNLSEVLVYNFMLTLTGENLFLYYFGLMFIVLFFLRKVNKFGLTRFAGHSIFK